VLGFLNVYPFVYSWVADHFQYLATLGIIIPVSALAAARIPRPPAAAVLLAVLSILTWRETRMYRDLETPLPGVHCAQPIVMDRHNNLANTLLDKPGKLPEAISLLKTTLQLKPDSAEAHKQPRQRLYANEGPHPRFGPGVRDGSATASEVSGGAKQSGERAGQAAGTHERSHRAFSSGDSNSSRISPTLTTTSVRRFSNSQEGRATRSSNTKSLWSWDPHSADARNNLANGWPKLRAASKRRLPSTRKPSPKNLIPPGHRAISVRRCLRLAVCRKRSNICRSR